METCGRSVMPVNKSSQIPAKSFRFQEKTAHANTIPKEMHAGTKYVAPPSSLKQSSIESDNSTRSRYPIAVQTGCEPMTAIITPDPPHRDAAVFVDKGTGKHKTEPSSTIKHESGTTATEPAGAETDNSAIPQISDQDQQSDIRSDMVVLDLGPSSEDKMYPFNDTGLWVGRPEKVKPSVSLETKWEEEIRPRLTRDIAAFQWRTKPKRKRRIFTPKVTVDLRMSGHVKSRAKQVTLIPTVWFLYNHRHLKNETRDFVEDLEWLTWHDLGASEIQLGGAQFTALHIPADHLQLSNSAFDGILLPADEKLYMHVEKPRYQTACGLLCCATFVQNGRVKTQHVSRIGGLLELGATTAAITTAHGFLGEMFSTVDHCESGADTDSEDGCRSDDDEESQMHRSEHSIGGVDPEILETTSWFQISPTAIRETCLFRLNGPNITQIVSEITSYHAGQTPNTSSEESVRTPQSADTLDSQVGDFSFLDIFENEALYNRYRSSENKGSANSQVISGVADPGKVASGRVELLLRPEKSSQGILLAGSILLKTYDVTLKAYRIVLNTPLAPGCSGTWVVQEGLLCGMIIASYVNEPYAVMITTFQLINDIRAVFPYISTVKLPGAEENRVGIMSKPRDHLEEKLRKTYEAQMRHRHTGTLGGRERRSAMIVGPKVFNTQPVPERSVDDVRSEDVAGEFSPPAYLMSN